MINTLGNAIYLGIIAAIATYLTGVLGWPTWVLFISWACYFLFGADPKTSGFGLFQVALGVIIGMIFWILVPVFMQAAPGLGLNLTLSVMVFLLVIILVFLKYTPVSNIAAYFVGVPILFAAAGGAMTGFVPDIPHLLVLLGCVALGYAFGYATVLGGGVVNKALPPPAPKA
jgi:hypothetical protein